MVPRPKLLDKTGHLPIPRFGVGPWIGAQVGSHRCLILRPGRFQNIQEISLNVEIQGMFQYQLDPENVL